MYRENVPQIDFFVLYRYIVPVSVLARPSHERLWSTTGVRQGDLLGPLLFSLGMQDVLDTLERECPDALLLAYLDDVYLQGPADAVEAAFHRFLQLCKNIGIDMVTEKCEAWSAGNAMGTSALSKRLGMQFAYEGIEAAGYPLGSTDFVQYKVNAAADKVMQLIKRMLASPLSAQDKLSLLRKSLQKKVLHLSRVA